MKTIILPVLFICLAFFPNQTSASIVSSQIIIQLTRTKTIQDITPQIKSTGIHYRPLSRTLNIWLVKSQNPNLKAADLMKNFSSLPEVLTCQYNKKVENRNIPNDENYPFQWQYNNRGEEGGQIDADIDAPEAWQITRGGKTKDGHRIVVAVIDGGINLEHPDFWGNIWTNEAEIPDNGIDDDHNGYIDDVYGWNFQQNTNDISNGGWGDSHGSPVAGIIGARGNNDIGVSGVNWSVKMMNLVRGNTEAEVIEAYNYVLEMRQRYNESSGEEGAFIVASNASFGIAGRQAEESPIWCSIYNELGKVGVLNVGATANEAIDVEIEGDIPSTCQSDFLIAVTNTTKEDLKANSAAYGGRSIDLGAPGAETYTVHNLEGYGLFYGTSAATPHVTGAIALLYSVRSNGLMESLRQSPEWTALLIKEFILAGVDPIEDLEDITVSGGRLNLYGSMLQLKKYFDEPLPSFDSDKAIQIQSVFPNPCDSHTIIKFEVTEPSEIVAYLYNPNGQMMQKIDFGYIRAGNHEKLLATNDLTSGVYFLGLRQHNQTVEHFKIVVH